MPTISSESALPTEQQTATKLLWLDLTRKCQLACKQCYNASGPDGTHGSMRREDWLNVLDQAAACGVERIQFIGGEPTMHLHFAELVDHALNVGLHVEVYSNLVHVSAECWEVFQRDGLSLATSYYSDLAEQHNAVTGRPSHARTRGNIERAVGLGIPLRVGIIDGGNGQRVDEAREDLKGMGVSRISVDHVRPFGRGAEGQAPDATSLCGRCGAGRAVISPSGEVAPCVFSTWMGVGKVQDAPLASILNGTAMSEATKSIRRAVGRGGDEDDDNSGDSSGSCGPVGDGECSPGYPSSSCSPRS
ncbi:radical SAM/SPASM domain-containing protein [Streptomyces lydicamycinicus]|uniref:radical SAM/SPASM domain-containing protein n=1 Tax=Streptomyces lydicamycinicus TaxID=1546107 RepID=UPI003C305CC1